MAGEPYRDRLLPLPPFLAGDAGTHHAPGNAPDGAALRDGFALTGYFLEQHIWGPRELTVPEERTRFVALGLAAA